MCLSCQTAQIKLAPADGAASSGSKLSGIWNVAHFRLLQRSTNAFSMTKWPGSP